MAYFANGEEGRRFEVAYCNRCVHGQNYDCPVMCLHELWNYDQIENGKREGTKADILNMFIADKGVGRMPVCQMFHAQTEAEKEATP